MRKVAIHFPIIVYPSEHSDIARFTAHCLNLDIIADGDSIEEAVSSLLETIAQQLDAAEEHGADPLHFAPQCYWDMLAQAREVPRELLERMVNQANWGQGREPLAPSQLEIRELQAT